MPTLFIVATPIGNLEDISLRAIRTLREVTLIAAEDTRKSKRLLNKYDIVTPITSYFEHNKQTKTEYIISRLDQGDVALISSAGMPGISDPGYELISAAIKQNIRVEPVPGPSVIVSALVVSGLPTDRFLFIGFPSNRASARRKTLKSVVGETATMVILEAPHRLPETLTDILAILGDRRIAVCRELTKLHEEVWRGTVSGAIAHFAQPRGEFALVIEGKRDTKPELTEDTGNELSRLRRAGLPAKEAIARVSAATGLSRKQLYRAWLETNKS